jgi:hypothetical protein
MSKSRKIVIGVIGFITIKVFIMNQNKNINKINPSLGTKTGWPPFSFKKK